MHVTSDVMLIATKVCDCEQDLLSKLEILVKSLNLRM